MLPNASFTIFFPVFSSTTLSDSSRALLQVGIFREDGWLPYLMRGVLVLSVLKYPSHGANDLVPLPQMWITILWAVCDDHHKIDNSNFGRVSWLILADQPP
jgi:hypothetical protein